MIDEDEIFDSDDSDLAVRITNIRARRWVHDHWWYKPAHVCRRWRNLILGSASFLDLYLVCTLGTPVADMLAHSPPLPLAIDYLYRNRDVTAEDEEGIFLALEQPNRIRCIRVGLSFRDSHKFVRAIDDELPILECLVMATCSEDDATLVLPKTIQAPRLRHLVLMGVSPPMGSRLLTTAVGIVTLCLNMHDSSTYLNPDSLLQWISRLSQLETLVIINLPNRDVETQLSHVPTITHAALPNLRPLSLQDVGAYLEVLIRHITAPRLETLHVKFFEQLAFSIPYLVRFMNTSEKKRFRFDIAKFEFPDEQVHVETEEKRQYSFSISGDYLRLNGHISFMAQIVDALGQVFSAVKNLVLDDEEDSRSSEDDFEVEIDRTEWYNLLRPFSNVKSLCINHGLVEEFSRYLRLDGGELRPELLPELQELTYSGSSNSGDGFTSFIGARQKAGHPVSLVHRSYRVEAIRLLLKSTQDSESRGNAWLSVDEVIKVIDVFEHDERVAKSFLIVASKSNESFTRRWVLDKLVQRGADL